MLLLSRKQNERIFIDDGPDKIEVCVVDIRGNTVRLGFIVRTILTRDLAPSNRNRKPGLERRRNPKTNRPEYRYTPPKSTKQKGVGRRR